MGLFLCAELDEAVLSSAVFELCTNPVEATSDLPTIIGVLIGVKRLKNERPFIGAKVNGLCRR
jgi:hypothetical protein